MISIPDPEAAKEVNQLVMEAWKQLDHSVAVVRETCKEDEVAEYLQEPLYRQHPALKPAGWTDEYDDKPLLDPD
jgi:hypothetical protein